MSLSAAEYEYVDWELFNTEGKLTHRVCNGEHIDGYNDEPSSSSISGMNVIGCVEDAH